LGRELHHDEYNDGHPGQVLEILWTALGHKLEPPQLGEYLKRDQRFKTLLGDFNHPVVVALDPNSGRDDDSRVGRLVRFVSDLDVSEGHLVIDEFASSFRQVRVHQELVHARTVRTARTHPSVALLRLQCLDALDREPGAVAEAASRPRDPAARRMLVVRSNAGGGGWTNLLDDILRKRRDLSAFAAAPAMVSALRAAAQGLGNELQGRLGTTRSRLAVVERYAARCEWHDRERLRQVADGPTQPTALPSKPKQREHALRNDLSRYLFDQGLNPLSEAVLGDRARADLFAPAAADGFICEAKQYTDGRGLPSALRDAFRQALDTVGTLRGSGYAVQEAFIVLFRRGGPRALLPREPLRADGLRWYFVLINIADPQQDASRNRNDPNEYTVEDLRSLLIRTAHQDETDATAARP